MSDERVLPLRSKAVAGRVLKLALAGKSLVQIAEEIGCSVSSLTKWQVEDPAFGREVREARQQAVREGRRPAKGPGMSLKTPERVQRILDALATGCGREHAAAAGGISHPTWRRWLDDDEDLERRALIAELDLQQRMLARVQAAGQGWQAAAWMLERRFQETYAIRRDMSTQERTALAKRMGAGLVDLLLAGLGDLELTADQHEAIRKRLAAGLEKAATA